MLRELLSRFRTRHELARLSARMLRDIGIEPATVRPSSGPSPLVLQPALLAQLPDPPAAARAEPEQPDPSRPLWIIHLRAQATRPI